MRALALIALAACGRVDYDPTCGMSLTAGSANVNSRVSLVVAAATQPVTFEVVAGDGTVSATGEYQAPGHPERATVRATDAAGCQADATVVVAGAELFYAGGNDPAGVPQADVWRSADGATWTAAAPLPGPRTAGVLLVHEDRLLYLGGYSSMDENDPRTEIFASSDGAGWQMLGTLPLSCFSPGRAVLAGRIFLVGCVGRANVWWSDDGLTWTATNPFPHVVHGAPLVAWRGGVVYFGGHDTGVDPFIYRDELYESVDGLAWTLRPERLPDPREHHPAAVFGDRIWITGGSGGSIYDDALALGEEGLQRIGTLPRPTTWHSLVGWRDLLWSVGGGVDTWSTADGVSWTGAGQLPASRDGGDAAAFTPR